MLNQLNHYYRVGRRFLSLAYSLYDEKNCQKSAGSLTYMTLFAIVPMLTVCYSMFSLIPAFQTVGDQFQAGEDRFAPVVTVVHIEDDRVTLDANHPLAGVELTFDVEVVAVRRATEAELQHGHAHGGDGAAGCAE